MNLKLKGRILRRIISDFRLQILFCLLLITFASLFVVFSIGTDVVNFGDGEDYLRSADSIFSSSGYLRDGLTWPFFRPPGYPFVIATLWKLSFSHSVIILKFFNIFLHIASTYLVLMVVKRKHSNLAALLASMLFGLNPFVLIPLSDIQTEPLTLFLFLFFCYFLSDESKKLHILKLSFVAILLVAVRPEYLIILLSIIGLLLFKKIRTKKTIYQVCSILLTLTLGLSWWGIQNKEATGSFIPLTNATNYLLWNGSTEFIYNNYGFTLSYDQKFDSKQYTLIQNEISTKIKKWGPEYSNATLGKKSQFWFSEYTHNIEVNPLRYLSKTLEKATIFWRPFLNPRSHGLKISLVSLLVLLPLTFGMLLVLYRGRRQFFKDIFVKSYLAGLFGLTVIHALQMPDQRYKFPLLIPFSTILLAPASLDLLSILFRRSFSYFQKRRNEKL